jgi:hypothetical protein
MKGLVDISREEPGVDKELKPLVGSEAVRK